jgi:hypothetical protein
MAAANLRLQILGRRVPIYAKRLRNRVGRLALCSQPSDLITQFGGELRPTDLDTLRPGSRHGQLLSVR